ncbi:MAG TPA: DedA family protein [Microlunatus sp.]
MSAPDQEFEPARAVAPEGPDTDSGDTRAVPADPGVDSTSVNGDLTRGDVDAPGAESVGSEDAEGATDDEPRQKEWWEDAKLPWKGKPRREDILCWVGFSLSGIIGLIMIPLRPVLLGSAPLALVAITGSRSGLVTIGALASVGRADWWPLGLILGIVSCMKWDPLFWWAGKLWGHGLIELVAGRSKWAARNAGRAEALARRYGVPAILLAYVLPLPAAVIYATLGMAGMRLRKFLIVDLIGAAVICSLWVFLGHQLGQSAVNVVDLIARYSGYISIGLLVIIIGQAVWRARRRTPRA